MTVDSPIAELVCSSLLRAPLTGVGAPKKQCQLTLYNQCSDNLMTRLKLRSFGKTDRNLMRPVTKVQRNEYARSVSSASAGRFSDMYYLNNFEPVRAPARSVHFSILIKVSENYPNGEAALRRVLTLWYLAAKIKTLMAR